MKKNTVKNIIIFFLVFLPLQYAVVGIVGVMKSEPWPAFILPAFKSVYSTQDQIAVDQIHFYLQNSEQDTVTEIAPEVLFKEVNGSQRQGFFRTHFSDSSSIAEFDAKTKGWLKDRVNRLSPSFDGDQLNIEWIKKIFNVSATDTAEYTTKMTKHFSIFFESE